MKTDLHRRVDEDSPNQIISFTVTVDSKVVKIQETPFGFRFDLGQDFKTTTAPGTPSLPSKIVQIALPLDAGDITVRAESLVSRKLFDKPVFIMPVPELRIAGKARQLDKEAVRVLETKIKATQQEDEPRLQPRSFIPYFDPEAKTYAKAFEEAAVLATHQSSVEVGGNRIVSIQVNPITFSEYVPVLHEQMTVYITYQRDANKLQIRNTTFRSLPQDLKAQSSIFNELKDAVLNPVDVIDLTRGFGAYFRSYDYIVITDNNRWDSNRIEPTGPAGDMVASFQKLVEWKREKGLRAAVITISNIVNGTYGNFKTGARDLQEVIRNFLKHARSNWGVTWVLLGGDIEIIPVRKTAGEIRGDVTEQTTNSSPENGQSYWTGSYMKIKAVDLGDWFSIYDSYLELTSKNTGRRIPRKSPRNLGHVFNGPVLSETTSPFRKLDLQFFETIEAFRSRLGWYFCTDNTYQTYSADPTNFIRVDGPASIIRAPLRFHYTWNTIPTDFYYSSLFGPGYGVAGKHDWDPNGNGIYGQYEGTTQFDPINWNADVIVGRAPASTPADADAFVSKVTGYEKLPTLFGPDFLRKMLLVSDNWGHSPVISKTNSNLPDDNQFFTDTAQGRAVMRLADDLDLSNDWHLVAALAGGDMRVIEYNMNAGPSDPGWYYAKSLANLSPATHIVIMPWGDIFNLPVITDIIVVYGDAVEISPLYYILDPLAEDGSMKDQEALRVQVDAELPTITKFKRIYNDLTSLSPAAVNAAPLEPYTATGVRAALNEGQHFVSLSGHGSQSGCCYLSTGTAASLTNGSATFIAYADSCLTSGFDTNDAMGEALINNPNGGAVAYVGSTRFSWIGAGDDIQRRFFHEMTCTRHLGLLHNSRLWFPQNNPGNHVWKWSALALNLLGDPEMEIWKRSPLPFGVFYFDVSKYLRIRVFPEFDPSRRMNEISEILAIVDDSEQKISISDDGYFDVPKELIEKGNLQLRISAPDGLVKTIGAAELKARMLELSRYKEYSVEEEDSFQISDIKEERKREEMPATVDIAEVLGVKN
ncbi:C25 family cysteine peptidase [Chitinophaga ginsengisoli]|uniref:Peptidase C25-like protein n=1 Tax=Chitinophaga ginsengisoli TaxID=363837 RepID=A0A2P8FR06_9BACT|nr:C25 family cysteine peptidase [Chitinophaga ginsengisoli]PSL24154.1 peptidase C25-like protein [Chitinophaga ginsengisoli]